MCSLRKEGKKTSNNKSKTCTPREVNAAQKHVNINIARKWFPAPGFGRNSVQPVQRVATDLIVQVSVPSDGSEGRKQKKGECKHLGKQKIKNVTSTLP